MSVLTLLAACNEEDCAAASTISHSTRAVQVAVWLGLPRIRLPRTLLVEGEEIALTGTRRLSARQLHAITLDPAAAVAVARVTEYEQRLMQEEARYAARTAQEAQQLEQQANQSGDQQIYRYVCTGLNEAMRTIERIATLGERIDTAAELGPFVAQKVFDVLGHSEKGQQVASWIGERTELAQEAMPSHGLLQAGFVSADLTATFYCRQPLKEVPDSLQPSAEESEPQDSGADDPSTVPDPGTQAPAPPAPRTEGVPDEAC